MNKTIMLITAFCLGLSACGSKDKPETNQAKSAFLNSCIKQESSSRPVEQAESYCDCVADSVFSNSDISDATKKLMSTINDKEGPLYKQSDATKVRGALMACYTSKFYKK